MATRHVSKESFTNSSVNPVTERDRFGQTQEEIDEAKAEMSANQAEAAVPFMEPVAKIKASLDTLGFNTTKLGEEKTWNTVEHNDTDIYASDIGLDGVADMIRLGEQASNETGDIPRELKPYEKTFVNHMQSVGDVYEQVSKIDFNSIKNAYPDAKNLKLAHAEKLRHDLHVQYGTAESDAKLKLEDQINALSNFILAESSNRGLTDGNVAHDYIVQAEYANGDAAHNDEFTDDPEGEQARAHAFEELDAVEALLTTTTKRNQAMVGGYAVMAEYAPKLVEQNPAEDNENPVVATPNQQPVQNPDTLEQTGTAPTPEQAPKEITPEIRKAMNELDDLRSKMADLNAKREKRLPGAGAWRGQERYSEETKALYDAYHKASRDLFMLENQDFLSDDSIANEQKILKIAAYTVSEAGTLDAKTLDSYKNKKGFFGKVIEKYGNLGKVGKIVIGIGASATAGALTGGVGTAVTSGSLMAMSFEDRRRKQREGGADMLSFDSNELADKFMGYDLSENGSLESVFMGTQLNTKEAFENRIDKEQKQRAKRVLGSLAFGATVGAISHNFIPGMDGMFGGEQASAATPDGASIADTIREGAPVPTSQLDSVANFMPNNFIVNPGDGFNNLFQNMNIPQDQWASVLDKVGPDLLQSGDAYTMADGGIGITNPGQLSQHAFDAIMNAR